MPDVVELIMADHREVERLFEMLQKEPDKRALTLPTVSALLIAHSRAEEAEVYPVARSEAGEVEEVAHSQHEHAEAEEILAELTGADPTSSRYDTLVQKLIDGVTHHVSDEEKEVLPGMKKQLSAERRNELGQAFAAARARHLGDRPGEATRDELAAQARNLGKSGVSTMTKDQLERETSS
ncbi:MAG TPA: hemerythrin domain-containing protein [Mycobacteriales bacterium]|nr:hemerythrin domain-containing protein [Mycobacteriales bacterium]